MSQAALAEIVQRLPKAELHCHLDGSLRPGTLLELSQARGLTLPVHEVSDLARWMRADDAADLESYLARFATTLAVMQSAAELERVAHELVLDAALDGTRYIEVRFCPALNVRDGLSLSDVMDAVLKGLARGERETGTVARLIVCALRSLPAPHAQEMSELAVAYKSRGVVAFDLAGGEAGNPAVQHAAAFDHARAHHLAVTVHAGEGDGPESIQQAVHHCGAMRIGHGTRLHEDAELEAWIVDRQIPLEVCPTSNVQTRVVSSFAAHPLARYVSLGAVVTLNTDNRLVSGVSLTEEYLGCMQHLGFDLAGLGRLAVSAFGAAFLPLAQRRSLQDQAERDIARLLADTPESLHRTQPVERVA